MGAEALCTGHFNRQSSKGKALLETDFILFRGDFRVSTQPFDQVLAKIQAPTTQP